ncbi:hypothetical protein M438DRAFT_101419 [Aureobasidium pullulans EXF-150]|uniref:Uncharacterized protein n=1 Tax=Aureobasidium pullulans EXF-150 TaxID=1043002 RepID=A0A074XBE2_AURPU|nr:uncharacterized protein M438DRAFT_101419 [Aureobasidium pullulans EXF-150]KEQ81039.1 hypothetical protein M438DRAFT_101419 [Aureobasidium pullulans EXF-150]
MNMRETCYWEWEMRMNIWFLFNGDSTIHTIRCIRSLLSTLSIIVLIILTSRSCYPWSRRGAPHTGPLSRSINSHEPLKSHKSIVLSSLLTLILTSHSNLTNPSFSRVYSPLS